MVGSDWSKECVPLPEGQEDELEGFKQDSGILERYFGNTLERGKFASRNTVRRLAED